MSSIGRLIRKNHAAVFWCTLHYPKAKREAVYTLYALFKHFDDLTSSLLPAEEKAEILAAWQEEVANIYEKNVPATDIGRSIYKNCLRFKLPRESLDDIVKGVAMDCPETMFRPSLKEFELYCRNIAEIPSYLILKVIAEFDEKATQNLASAIGRAVEITQILRNMKEDALGGHIYIPEEYLTQAGVEANLTAKEILTHKHLYGARQSLAELARQAYSTAYRLLEENHNKNSKPIVYMLNLYHTYFQMMDKRGWEVISPKPELKFKDRCKLICKALFHINAA